ncbi:hypothetical protein T07_3167 [Trichinella nelsoni]|uniref:Uncharacterized protein n=1 Tax=Trichinella nelsoni TaxID=6336 RepID=A0A0V0SNU8_9BILA|nr:hypothetical protein T07_3167 [Trichinella nelsoni]
MIMRYSLKFPTLVQYFFVLGNSIFLHFRFWKVPQQTNSYMSNKWPLKLPCAYLNTQESSRIETFLKRIQDG